MAFDSHSARVLTSAISPGSSTAACERGPTSPACGPCYSGRPSHAPQLQQAHPRFSCSKLHIRTEHVLLRTSTVEYVAHGLGTGMASVPVSSRRYYVLGNTYHFIVGWRPRRRTRHSHRPWCIILDAHTAFFRTCRHSSSAPTRLSFGPAAPPEARKSLQVLLQHRCGVEPNAGNSSLVSSFKR